MRLRFVVALSGLLVACGGDSSSEMSAFNDSGVGGAPAATGGGVGYAGIPGLGGMAAGAGGIVADGGQPGSSGGSGGGYILPDASPTGTRDSGPAVTVDVAVPPDVPPPRIEAGRIDLPGDLPRIDVGRLDSSTVDVMRTDSSSVDFGRPDVARAEVTVSGDVPVIRGFDAELAENLLPSAVTCCHRVYGLVDGGTLAFCDDLARGDAWRAYQYLLFLQQQGLLCTDLPY